MQRLTEASTMWQIRARQAEEQLKLLTAGDIVPENAPEAVESPERDGSTPTGVLAWVKRVRRFWSGEGEPR